jgi:hypothetical protein
MELVKKGYRKCVKYRSSKDMKMKSGFKTSVVNFQT